VIFCGFLARQKYLFLSRAIRRRPRRMSHAAEPSAVRYFVDNRGLLFLNVGRYGTYTPTEHHHHRRRQVNLVRFDPTRTELNPVNGFFQGRVLNNWTTGKDCVTAGMRNGQGFACKTNEKNTTKRKSYTSAAQRNKTTTCSYVYGVFVIYIINV